MPRFDRYCTEHGVKALALPERPPLTEDAEGWAHYAYTVTLEYQGRTMATPFKCGGVHARKLVYNDARIPVPPSAADVLYSLILDSDALDRSFEEWACDFGYDTDSRKALDTYLDCQRAGHEVRALLGDDFQAFADASREY
jgi:hypothetical protein